MIEENKNKQLAVGLCLLLIAGIIAVYGQTVGFDFVDYDDPSYVTGCPQVLAGLTWDGVKWAFTAAHAGNWIPLVWLSLMADRTLFGVWPGGFHLVNVAIHIANAILLFLILKRYTKAIWPSFFVAALFALHPLHVESVAWVTERKDTLSTFFWLLTMLAYLRYMEVPTVKRYVIICVVFSLGLMSKSMLVTLPLVLLLMDYWPLRRLWPEDKSAGITFGRLIREKIPMLILSAAVCVVTVITQNSGGAVAKIIVVPLGQRVGNALVSYCQYLIKMFWPVDLAVFYPYPVGSIAGWKIAASLIVLLVITIVVLLLRRRRYLVAGWFWYLGTLAPVIGIVQVGAQSMADRYTYVPLTGIFIMFAWLARDVLSQSRYKKLIAGIGGSAIIGALAVVTFAQVGFWKDTLTLFNRCADVTPDNVIMRKYLGIGFARKGDAESALREFKESLRFESTDARTYYNIGQMLVALGRTDEAAENYSRALELRTDNADAYAALASMKVAKGEIERAIELYNEGIKRNPGDGVLHNGLGVLLLSAGRADDAIQEFEQAVKLKPDSTAYFNLGLGYAAKKQMKTAMESYAKAIQLDPANADAHYNLGNAYLAQNVPQAAIMEYREAILAKPDYAKAYSNMAAALMQTGQLDEAISNFRRAIEIGPNNIEANFNLAVAIAKKGQLDEAIGQMRKTVELAPSDEGARCELAGMLLQKGKVEEAIIEYQQALKINPADKNALAGLEKAKAASANKSQQ
jgi:protein O-mannosyl-transferase